MPVISPILDEGCGHTGLRPLQMWPRNFRTRRFCYSASLPSEPFLPPSLVMVFWQIWRWGVACGMHASQHGGGTMTRHASPLTRRGFLASSAVAGIGLGTAGQASAPSFPASPESDPYTFEITRTEEEWRALLDDESYVILRGGADRIAGLERPVDRDAPGHLRLRRLQSARLLL
ncbi:hypothetical protein DLJ49_05755 [Rhodovulum sp. 12E13]|nr:hypothetical protein DLJ49_05755 [Rhodovulum sp. 12E13]